jgi:predicted signal transduction protein with EAL and GGDEF domain
MYEWHPVRRDGMQLTILWSNILLPDNSILNIGLDITERKKAEQQLAVKATTDDLTGCFNRSAILQQLKSALAANSRQDADSQFCVLMFDLDYFKQINDEWGHLVGDAALIHFCDRLRESARQDRRWDVWEVKSFYCCWRELTAMPLCDSPTSYVTY